MNWPALTIQGPASGSARVIPHHLELERRTTESHRAKSAEWPKLAAPGSPMLGFDSPNPTAEQAAVNGKAADRHRVQTAPTFARVRSRHCLSPLANGPSSAQHLTTQDNPLLLFCLFIFQIGEFFESSFVCLFFVWYIRDETTSELVRFVCCAQRLSLEGRSHGHDIASYSAFQFPSICTASW
jgi:hypothetical protein